MEYKIVSGSQESILTDFVNAEIKKGWIPQGGISTDDIGFSKKYIQAMIKK